MPFIALKSPAQSNATKQLAVICLSNTVAYFDFLIYLYMADIINASFFPANDNPLLESLQILTLFAAGYMVRPIGALLLGRYGDVKGRKPALLIGMLFISFSTLVTACLPTYQQAGMLAPILFFTARLIQGMAFGAHSPLGWVFIAEHVGSRNIATYCSIVTSSFFVAGLAASGFFELLNSTYTHAELIDYGWRVPFVVGAMFSFIALMLWHVLEETPIFLQQQKRQRYLPKYTEIVGAFRRFNALFIATILSFVMSSLVIIIALLLPQLVLLKFSIDESMLVFANNLGLLFLVLGCVFFGLVADKSGTGKAFMIGAVALILQALTFYYHLANGDGSYILILYAILGFCTGIIGLASVVLVQLFPTEVRLTAVSLTYNITYAIVGTALPVGLMYATNIISFSPALYLTFVGLVCFIIGLYLYRSPKARNLDT